MRRLLFMILLLSTIIPRALADDETFYRFYYIAQSGLSQKSKIIDKLIKIWDDAKDENWNCVFYLANTDKPIIVSINDDYDKFNDLIHLIQNSNGFEVRPSYDAEKIIEYLQTNPYFDKSGKVKDNLNKVYFNFYVNSDFWNTNGNRDLIAALYCALDVEHQDDAVLFDVFISTRDRDEGDMVRDEAYPFEKIAPKKLNDDFKFNVY